MQIGDAYDIPITDSHRDDTNHDLTYLGVHTATVKKVRSHPVNSGPDPDDGGPDVVTSVCTCGAEWTFEDIEADY